jgi:nuclear migration protein JNM1
VDFSESLAGGRRSYKTSTRRRRRRDDQAGELGNLSDSEDESLGRKLARLKREAEEVKVELQRRDERKGQVAEEEDSGLEDGVGELGRMLDGLYAPSRGRKPSAEAALSKKLASDLKTEPTQTTSLRAPTSEPSDTAPQPSTLTSLATISDRLSALETSLGISAMAATFSTPILPALASLTSQVKSLTTTLSPPSPSATGPTTPLFSSMINLDTLTSRVRDLTTQSDRLTSSRKAAIQAAKDLRQARLKAATASIPSLPAFPPTPTPSQPHLTPNYQHQRPSNLQSEVPPQETLGELLGYEEQNAKISALYATIPRIQELSPLLPLVLERLRSLQTIHAGAAQATGDLEALERVQAEVGKEIEEWKGTLEKVEDGLRQGEERMRANQGLVTGLVKGVEDRLSRLEGEQEEETKK